MFASDLNVLFTAPQLGLQMIGAFYGVDVEAAAANEIAEEPPAVCQQSRASVQARSPRMAHGYRSGPITFGQPL